MRTSWANLSWGWSPDSASRGVQVERPYMRLGIADLTDIVDDPGASSEIRDLVVDELRHRSSPGARRLLARLGGGVQRVGDETPATGRRGKVAANEKRVPVTRAPTIESAPHVVDRDAVLAALRETYSQGSEILARWGMTTAIPPALFDVVVAWWEESLTEDVDRFGRSKSRLSGDVARIRSLGSLGGNGGIGDV